MSALGMASLGVQCQDKALGMSSLGLFCDGVVVVDEPTTYPGGGGRGTSYAPYKLPKYDIEQIQREDEEIIAIVIAAIEAGIIK